MSRIQLGLPLSVVARLNDNEKSKLILQQCVQLQIDDGEVTALLKMCSAKGKVSKGFALLFRYAGLVDEIRDSVSELMQVLSSRAFDSSSSFEILPTISFHNELLLTVLKLTYLLCNWRKMQWMPRPILLDADGTLVTLTMFLEKVFKYFVYALRENIRQATGEEVEIVDDMSSNLRYLIYQCRSGCTDFQLLNVDHVIQLFLEVVGTEQMVEDNWQKVINLPIQSNLPILCLPYPGLQNQENHNKWFLAKFKRMSIVESSVESIFLQIFTNYLQQKHVDLLLNSLSCLKDVTEFQHHFSKQFAKDLSYISTRNQMNVGAVAPLIFRSTWVPFILSTVNHLDSSPTRHSNRLAASSSLPSPTQYSMQYALDTRSPNSPQHSSSDKTPQLQNVKAITPQSAAASLPFLVTTSDITVQAPLLLVETASVEANKEAPATMSSRLTEGSFDALLPTEESHNSKVYPQNLPHPTSKLPEGKSSATVVPLLAVQEMSRQNSNTTKASKGKREITPLDTSNFDDSNHIPIAVKSVDDQPQKLESTQSKEVSTGDNSTQVVVANEKNAPQFMSHSSSDRKTPQTAPLSAAVFSPSSAKTMFVENATAAASSATILVDMPLRPSATITSEHKVDETKLSEIMAVNQEATTLPEGGHAPVVPTPHPASHSSRHSQSSVSVDKSLMVASADSVTAAMSPPAAPSSEAVSVMQSPSSPHPQRQLPPGNSPKVVRHALTDEGFFFATSPGGGNGDEEEVIYLVRYDPHRRSAPDGSKISHLRHIHQARQNQPQSFIEGDEDNILHEDEQEFNGVRRPNSTGEFPSSSQQDSSFGRPRFFSTSALLNGPPQQQQQYHRPVYNRNSINSASRARQYSDPINGSARKTYRGQVSHSPNPRWSAKQRLRGIDFSAQSLSAALRTLDMMSNMDDEERAARKIAIWYMIVAPRRKLLRRLDVREFIGSIVTTILDKTYQIATIKQRRRIKLMRHGASTKIQRFFRTWRARMIAEEEARDREERQERAWKYLDEWRSSVMNSVRLYRFLRQALPRHWRRQEELRARNRAQQSASSSPSGTAPRANGTVVSLGSLTSTMSSRKTIRASSLQSHPSATYLISPTTGYRIGLAEVVSMYFQEFVFYTKFGRIRRMSTAMGLHIPAPDDVFLSSQEAPNHGFSVYNARAAVIQSAFRAYLGRRSYVRKRYEMEMTRKLLFFILRCTRRRRRKRAELWRRSSTLIQKWVRGAAARRHLLERVRAGLMLKTALIRYIHYKKLKSQLRRVDRPISISLHGVRNIIKRNLNTDELRVKVSVWWNPLLHIVGENDSHQIIHSKPPQFIYSSAIHRVTTEDDKYIPELAQSRGRRSLGTFVNQTKSIVNNLRKGSIIPLSSTVSSKALGPVGETAAINQDDSPEEQPEVDDLSNLYQDRRSLKQRRSANIHIDGGSGTPPAGSPPMPTLRKGASNAAVAAAAVANHNANVAANNIGNGGTANNTNVTGRSPTANSALRKRAVSTDSIELGAGTSGGVGGTASSVTSAGSKSGSDSTPQFDPRAASLLANRIRQRRLSSAKLLSPDGDSVNSTPDAASGAGARGRLSSVGENEGAGGQSLANTNTNTALNSNNNNHNNNNNNPHATHNSSNITNSKQLNSDDESDSKDTSDIFYESQHKSAASMRNTVVRNTLAFAFGISALGKQSSVRKKTKVVCNFEDETFKIPGCHGNSVFKFEVFDGE